MFANQTSDISWQLQSGVYLVSSSLASAIIKIKQHRDSCYHADTLTPDRAAALRTKKPQTLLITRICIGVNCAITSICQPFLSGCVVPLWSFWHAGNEFFLTEWNWPSCGSAGEWCLLLPGCERALCGPSFFTSYQKVHASGGPVIRVAIWYSRILSWLLTLPTDLFFCF